MIKYKIRCSDWLTFLLIIVNFNHFFIQPAPGVPQGSILGRTLFAIFTNDFPDVVKDRSQTALYADDSKVYIIHDNNKDTCTFLFIYFEFSSLTA